MRRQRADLAGPLRSVRFDTAGRAGVGARPACSQREIKAEIKAVVRISKQLIDDVVTRKEIVATIPYDAIVLGFRCQGVIDGRGKLSVDMTTDKGDGTFIINSQGTAETYVRGVRGPIVALGPAWGPFTSRTLVRFDGRKFYRVETTPCAQVHGELDRVEGRHGGRSGVPSAVCSCPLGQLLVPRAEREATPIGEYYLKNFVNELAEKIVARLNRTTPVEASLNRLFPETKDWEFQLSTDPASSRRPMDRRAARCRSCPKTPGDSRIRGWSSGCGPRPRGPRPWKS